ncbi:signal peptidase II [Parapedobacter lycopersici]|uniref:signal peptidase II n=1 Tax=Parapedobacter lycopersici TaxID=1864939 RepID=UPI0033402536
MAYRKMIRAVVLLLLVACNVSCDQVSKTIARQQIDYGEQLKLASGYFTFTKVENRGAFLSLGHTLPEGVRFFLLSVVPLLVLLYGLYYLFTQHRMANLLALGLSFALGGGLGNLYDRWRHGSVTDFMHIDFVVFQTGIFNMADVSLTIGVIIMFIALSLERQRASVNQAD